MPTIPVGGIPVDKLPPEALAMIGKTFGHYRIIEKIGAGGMGIVYRAHDEQLDRDVALKVLPSEPLTDETARARLLRKARMASKLNHPHICIIHEVGEAEGQAYIARELVEGQSLNARIKEGSLPSGQILRYGAQVAGGAGARAPVDPYERVDFAGAPR